MAPAHVARASTNTDSIKGLAQSLANPAYRRLLVAEPALRRAVPLLIITFLFTMAVGTGVQIFDHHREASVGAVDEIELFADYLASRLDGEAARPQGQRRNGQDIIAMALERRGGRTVLDRRSGRHHHRRSAGTRRGRAHAGRRARARPAADHVRRHRRRTPDAAVRRHQRDRDGAQPAFAARPARRHRPDAAGDVDLALRHDARGDAVRDHRLRRPHPRLRLPLAVDPRPRGRPHPRNRAPARRHRAQPRPLRPVGLGPRAGPGVLVAFDVRDPRPAAARPAPDLRRAQRPRAPRRRLALRARLADRGRPHPVDRPRLPHAPCRRPLGVAARALRDHAPSRRHRLPPDRHRRRHHRAEGDGGADRGRRRAAARRHRDDPRGLRAVGRRQPAGAVQLELPGAARPAGRGGGRRDGLRQDRRRRAPAAAAHARRRRAAARARPPAVPRAIPVRAPSRPSSTTAAGCTSASAAPRTAATSRSAPTSPPSSSTRRG